ncbi:MAG: hypothetical protein A2268_15365 [Candidatus Raymondbacteria bacterium RifOxyA12_full_50_37]|uniref:Radical SAM core domain-containing protein n=1 Tax=Candidatus Raymondbacteria bacterium RIFOXYD12_FULL_49_13 TaxID=1817890 RepID=A0A1F7F727_UNCRA|nr:MAG: hypothetical protein A2268_15365 [Candidatus Raymondbacteria bacterium RifOxyA12_full_50_37]OGJ88468.1 MAG: hypothetical protein A2248_19900 [Candidatus Raymondbacteria bacterium RIFOXYA2_FULL_49_16]OGJ98928.1 MAG: hypothetical protein A2453_10615 [Candidatus Raymondbacteria bacterium RIFOXYC2_FULL_50_21]OGK02372.1 MAG: hypothetical protein A2519_16000 [Candidatus Raymondbacteria bacterium RIFOXYD12_FULL_49_13]OGK07923.1 MAG: hypothetical protein A2487_12520 [Candidatus Raymondbacteria 
MKRSAIGLLGKGYTISQERFEEYKKRIPLPLIQLVLTNYCSHGCWYCNQGSPYILDKSSVIDSMGESAYIAEVLKLAGQCTCEYLLFGGEPLDHPSCVNITTALLERGHTVKFQTNGTRVARLDDLAAEHPEWRNRIKFQPSFHIGDYLLKKDGITRITRYIQEYLPRMARCGFKIEMIVVLTPHALKDPQLEQLLDIVLKRVETMDVDFEYRLVEYIGEMNGLQYPAAFTAGETARINYLRQKYQRLLDGKNAEELNQVNNELLLQGMPCFNMTRLIVVDARGNLRRCKTNAGILGQTAMCASDSIAPARCPSPVCTCASMGFGSSLQPHGISLGEYLRELCEESPQPQTA